MWRSSACPGKGNAEAFVNIMAANPLLEQNIDKNELGIEGGNLGIEIDKSEGDVASYFKQGKRRFI
jgi:hypothetical protein